MPTPSDTLHAIRGAADVNSAALSSVKTEAFGFLAEVEAWNPTPSKGLIRDQLARVAASFANAATETARLMLMASQAIDQLGTGGDPDVLPPSVPWSTGELQIAFGVSGRPTGGKELGRYKVVETVTWDAVLSAASADAPATADSDVVFSSAGVPIVVFHWLAGSNVAVVELSVVDSNPGDVIVVTAPAVQDATLAGIAGTLVGRRFGT